MLLGKIFLWGQRIEMLNWVHKTNMRGNTNKNKECESGGSTNWDFWTNLRFGWSLISEVWFYSCKYKETIFNQ